MNSVTQACASGVWWLSRLGMYSCKGKFHWHSLKMHTAAPVSRPVVTQKSSVSSFKKKNAMSEKTLAWFRWLLRPRKKTKKNKKRVAEMWGKDANALILHALDLKGFDQKSMMISQAVDWTLALPEENPFLLQYNWGHPRTAKFEWCGMVCCYIKYRCSWKIHWVWSCQSAVLLWHAAGIAQILRWNNQRTKGPALVIHPGIQTSSHNKMVFHCLKDRSFVWKSSNKWKTKMCWMLNACFQLGLARVWLQWRSHTAHLASRVKPQEQYKLTKNGLVWKLWVLSKCSRDGSGINISGHKYVSDHECTNINDSSSLEFRYFVNGDSRDAMDPGAKEGWFRVKQTCSKNVDEYRNNARHHLELQVCDEVKKNNAMHVVCHRNPARR